MLCDRGLGTEPASPCIAEHSQSLDEASAAATKDAQAKMVGAQKRVHYNYH